MIRNMVFMVFFSAVGIVACTEKKKSYLPSDHLTSEEEKRVKEQIIRFVAKAPRRVVGDIKFDTVYDEHYAKQVAQHDLMAYYVDRSGEHFFMVARVAPSIDVKWVATGGRMRYGTGNEIVEYEEVFRTWKLSRRDLDERATYLFDLMVKGEDLTPYYTATAGFNYIEFPDENVYFDKMSRSWKSRLYGSVEEMVYESRDSDSLQKK
jgi:hypothetical protein